MSQMKTFKMHEIIPNM